MPRLPDATAFGQRPTPTPILSGARIGGGDAEAGLVGPQLQMREAAAVGHTADVVHAQNEQQRKEFERLAKIEQEKVDGIRSEEAFTKLREHELELAAGDQGYSKVKGTEALGRPLYKEYWEKFQQKAKEIEQGLGNEDQRARFRARAGVASIGFREGLLRHLGAETKEAEKQQFEGMVTVESRAAISNWNNPGAVQASLARMLAGVDGLARSNNWDQEYTKGKKQDVAAKIHDAIIDQAIAAGNLTYAQEWYKANKDQVDANTAKSLLAKTVDAEKKQRYNGYQSAYLGVQDSLQGLRQLQEVVTKDAALDDASKNILIGRIQNQSHSLMRRQEALAERAERRVETDLNAALARISRGWEPTAEDLAPAIRASAGRPQVQRLLAEVIGTANATRAFRNMHPLQQEQALTQAEVGVRNGNVDPKLLTTFRSIASAQKEERNKDPTTYAVRQGISAADDPSGNDLAGKPIDWSRPDKIDPNQLSQRMDLGRYMTRNMGTPFKPMTTEEVAMATSALAQMDAKGRRGYFEALASNPEFRRDPNAYRAVMAQLAPDNPVVASAGLIASKKAIDPKHGDIAMLILRGDELLNPNRKTDGKSGGALVNLPPQKAFEKGWDDFTRNAYAGNAAAANTDFQAAKAIYATLTQASNDTDKSVLDPARWEESMRMATGGVLRLGSNTIVKPRGMGDRDFDDQRSIRLRALLESGRLDPTMTMSRLRDMGLRNTGDGKYGLTNGDFLLTDREGKPVTLDFNAPLPPLKTPVTAPSARELERARLERVNAARQPVPARERQTP